ncbi:MAG: hypothetical protein M1133_10580 [Armatimonadetes bacterium]|nr:hypothetical protein [Armatimonadota bacterium]
MNTSELSITVGELLSIPKVTLSGRMERWHDQAVMGVFKGFRDQGCNSLVLDIAGLNLAETEGFVGLINVLRLTGPDICIHVVTSPASSGLLQRARLGPCVRLYSSTDEIAEYVNPEEYLTSRYVAPGTEDSEMPMAA